MKFDQYFSLYEIVKTLSALRVKVASLRHRYQMYWSRLLLVDEKGKELFPATEIPSELDALLPPRRAWHRGKKESRKHQSGLRIASLSIVRTITGAEKSGTLTSSKWGQNLLNFYESVYSIVSQGEFCFSSPTIQLVRKGGGRVKTMDAGNKREAYRCISRFDKLEDRVILGKTATYLRDVFDSEFLDCCYAFRRNGRKFSFRKAVENLITYRQRFADKPLYVADCDVQKFFDVINHQVIRNAYESFVQRVGDRHPDARAGKILDAYLEAYSFPRNLEECCDLDVIAKRDCVERVPNEVLASLYPGCDLTELQLGVPQGGALSPLLANMVMDAVDRAVLSGGDDDLFYARFCDDMIIVHPNRRKCEEALNRYLNAMRLLKLPIHKLCKKPRCSASYFAEKSKGPVAWKRTSVGLLGTNWVNFLGHQIRYDGVVRVKKETVKKHQERLLIEKEELFRNLKKAKGQYRLGKDWKGLFKAFQLRIAAMGVGRIDVNMKVSSYRCWLSVFRKNLDPSGPAMSQMKNLDRTRSGILANVKGLMKSAWRSVFHGTLLNGEQDSARKTRMKKGYLGAPFSYYGSLKSLERPSLSDVEIDDESNIGVYGDL